ncbi:Bsp6I family type II restriction endonuclease [Methanosphaera sp. Vir-13MRS]|uniref:Bsp6I family type II restriction endonuclease n=1 Tax=Candidatus Methanosphaera massiliense TaxID=3017187 RepID=UPI0023800EAD|nr:Bsp6I family type II restriction endonuclease [Candidatus Methanosphaera massiliense]MDE4079000.1 Bsp6I family type II restriction endonuclease [Candidatus Methanosphaera massiliense]
MLHEERTLIIEDKEYTSTVDIVEAKDKDIIIDIYNQWRDVSSKLSYLGCRRLNFPEISELIFCKLFDCWRTNNIDINHSSFDCYNPKTNKRIQIKAASSKNELTSFGPKSVWDELYYMEFYKDETYDGTFDIYLIPNELIYNNKQNENETFVDQQKDGKRPRLHIRELIKDNNIKPIGTYNINDI